MTKRKTSIRASILLVQVAYIIVSATSFNFQKDPNEVVVGAVLQKEPSIIDVITIGSIHRPELMDAQEQTWGSHLSIRHFYKITEHNDTEAQCHTNLTFEHVQRVSKFCRRFNGKWGAYPMLNNIRRFYARPHWLRKKANPAGWICAQKRPLDGLYKVLKQYQDNKTLELPNYLVVVDDDTYFHFPRVLHGIHKLIPGSVAAGCLIQGYNITHPYGGFGTMIAKSALADLIRPLHCGNQTSAMASNESTPPLSASFKEMACWRIAQSPVGENEVFREGMSVLDMIQAYVQRFHFTDVGKWHKPGFCMHSDWVTGYFFNYYHIGSQSESNEDLVDRMQAFEGSLTSQSNPAAGECNHQGKNCPSDAAICHYQTAESMKHMYSELVGVN